MAVAVGRGGGRGLLGARRHGGCRKEGWKLGYNTGGVFFLSIAQPSKISVEDELKIMSQKLRKI